MDIEFKLSHSRGRMLVALTRGPGVGIDDALALWTAKEVVLKAAGDGLIIERADMSFAACTGAGRRPRVPPELIHLADWRVTHRPLPDAVGAVAQRRVA